ncbi:DUF1007 family protein [Arcobacter sp. YIC-80]|uniref:DUF1007 family protein n=1 Tax=Arcobacter sp. YIC-80 TaxID=3376683 RepID=UPI00384C72A7
MNLILRICFFIFLTNEAFSHPHTFIEVKPTINIKKETIDNFNIKWIIDEMTSMMLIMELDTDANGKFDKNENKYIFENYFSSLEKQNYYMSIYLEKKNITIKPKNFKASIEKNRLIYSFNIENIKTLKNLKIEFFDKDLFVGMIIEKKYIKTIGLNKNKSEKIKKSVFGVD